MIKGYLFRALAVLLLGIIASGCDKCGEGVKFNAPTFPKACGANAEPAK
jgi:hypothetical protein